MLIKEFSYIFLYVWNCMKLYDKKFAIYGNCMSKSFGQSGLATIKVNQSYLAFNADKRKIINTSKT